jgi:hypothetical protein
VTIKKRCIELRGSSQSQSLLKSQESQLCESCLSDVESWSFAPNEEAKVADAQDCSDGFGYVGSSQGMPLTQRHEEKESEQLTPQAGSWATAATAKVATARTTEDFIFAICDVGIDRL